MVTLLRLRRPQRTEYPEHASRRAQLADEQPRQAVVARFQVGALLREQQEQIPPRRRPKASVLNDMTPRPCDMLKISTASPCQTACSSPPVEGREHRRGRARSRAEMEITLVLGTSCRTLRGQQMSHYHHRIDVNAAPPPDPPLPRQRPSPPRPSYRPRPYDVDESRSLAPGDPQRADQRADLPRR